MRYWDRAIVLADMNSFFASVEQLDDPAMLGQPVAVTNGLTGTCVITSSYEARAYGIKTGMRLKEARRLCSGLIQRPARPRRYAEISTTIMKSLTSISPDIEVFSVDEAFIDISKIQRMSGHPIDIAQRIKQCIFDASGIHSSVGVSEGKLTAKWAAKQMKPDGFTILHPDDAKSALSNRPVDEICGIAKGIKTHLEHYRAYTCGDVARLPMSVLSDRFGTIGKRLWSVCNGVDPAPMEYVIPDPKTMGHGKVMPPNTTDKTVIRMYLRHMAYKVGQRLRKYNFFASQFSIYLRGSWEWIGDKYQIQLTQDDTIIYGLCERMLMSKWQGQGVSQVQITALDPTHGYQRDIFDSPNIKTSMLNDAKDKINTRYGELTLAPASLINKSDMPNVIAPAWKPYGHRNTIN